MTAGAPPPSGGSNKAAKIIAALVVVGGLGAGGVYLATRSDDKAKIAVATEATQGGSATTGAAAPVTEAPATTPAPTTTSTEPATTTTTTTTTSTIPPGAIDVGHGVYVPVPDGWTQTGEPGQAITITDGTSKVSIQALKRTPGEDTAILMQEYTDTFDAAVGTASFGPARYITRYDRALPIDEYGIFYNTFDQSTGSGLVGSLYTFQRSDGLSVVYDIFGSSNVMGIGDTAFSGFVDSLEKAPPLGDSATLTERAPFLVKSVHPYIEVDGLLAFTPAPGFTQTAAGGGYGVASNGSYDFAVAKLVGQASPDAALEQAKGSLANTFTAITFGDPKLGDPDHYGVVQRGVGWSGQYLDGTPAAGGIDVYFDPASGNAVAILRSWKTDGTDNTEPFDPEVTFMYRSITGSYTTIP